MPAWVSAETSASAYGVSKAGCLVVASRSVDSQPVAAALAGRCLAPVHSELPPTLYRCVITLASDSSAGSIAQVRRSCSAHRWPAASSAPSLPEAPRLAASEFVASVWEHAPCCG